MFPYPTRTGFSFFSATMMMIFVHRLALSVSLSPPHRISLYLDELVFPLKQHNTAHYDCCIAYFAAHFQIL